MPAILREYAIIAKSDLDHYETDAEGNIRVKPGVGKAATRAVRKKKVTQRQVYSKDGDLVSDTTVTDIELHDKLHALDQLKKHLGEEAEAMPAGGRAASLETFRGDPVGYARHVLRVELTPDQTAILVACTQPPYRVKAKAGHSVGKTFLAACLVSYFFDCYEASVTITTAPTMRDVVDLLWSEVRKQRKRAGLSNFFVGPSAPHMATGEDHWAKGYTASKGESFQGRHHEFMLFVFDEDEGIESSYFTTVGTMFIPDGKHIWFSIGNPTTTTSQSYREESMTGPDGKPKWNVFTLSCLNHPNIAAGLAGKPVPFPGAVTVEQVDQWVQDWCEAIDPRDATASDIEWAPGSGNWWRPGPLFQSRVLGMRPTGAANAVWSQSAFGRAASEKLFFTDLDLPELGVDVARFGDDFTEIHGRRGPCSIYHVGGNGWSLDTTFDRVKESCELLAREFNAGRTDRNVPYLPADAVSIKVDDDGVGGGLTDFLRRDGYNVTPVNAGTVPNAYREFKLRRDELWFEVAKRARDGNLDLTRLAGLDNGKVLARLKEQALAPVYWLDYAGRRIVEPKDDTKKRIGRSPDDMDSLNLAYADTFSGVPSIVERDR